MAARTPRHPFRDNRGRARWTTVTLLAVSLLNGVCALQIAYWLQTQDTLLPLDELEPAFTLVGQGMRIAAAILFVAWFHRAYANAHALGLRGSHGVGWAIGGWFVPILSFVYPFHIASQMWRHATAERVGAQAIVGLWWAALLIGYFTDSFGSGMVEHRVDATGMQVVFVSCLLGVASTALAIVMVRRLTAAQSAMHDLRTAEVFD